MSVTYTLDTRRLDRLRRQLPERTEDLIDALAFRVEAEAKVRAPVDTGALRASIYTRRGRQPVKLPDVPGMPEREELPMPRSEYTAYIGPSVEYGIDVELGTSRMRGRPYLQQAVRFVQRQMEPMFRDWLNE